MARKPLISIIVAVLNGEKTIERFLKSYAQQTFENTELIIVHGRSNDGTASLLNRHPGTIHHLIDINTNGIYPALNVGVAKATGEWLYFIGCDDFFFDSEALEKVAKQLDADAYDYIAGSVRYLNSGRFFYPRPATEWLFHSLHHQGTFYHCRIFDKFTYNESLSMASDYELTLRIYLDPAFRLRIVNTMVAYFDETGSSGKNRALAWVECEIIRKRVYGVILGSALNLVVKLLLKLRHLPATVRSKVGLEKL